MLVDHFIDILHYPNKNPAYKDTDDSCRGNTHRDRLPHPDRDAFPVTDRCPHPAGPT